MSNNHDRTAWIKGGAARCNQPPRQVSHPWRLALLGAPGVGKGTQAGLLSDRLGSCHLSTGDIFRAAKSLDKRELTPALASALDFMRRGELVNDETVLGMVSERLRCLHCSGGFLLDGFPRTEVQAEALEKLLQKEGITLNAVVNYEMEIDEIVARLAGRRSCPKCKAVFHVTDLPPKKAGVCDGCGTALAQREDDQPESVRVRIRVYLESATPLVNFYQKRHLLISVNAKGTADEICRRTVAALKLEKMRYAPPVL